MPNARADHAGRPHASLKLVAPSRREIDESSDAHRQMPALDDEHGVDVLAVARIEVFEHRLQPAGPDVGTNVELSQPRKTNSGRAR